MKCYQSLIACLFFFVIGCNSSNQTESTASMVQVLKGKTQVAQNEVAYPYFTDHLIQKLEASLNGLPYTLKQGTWLDYVLVLLLKGDNDACIAKVDAYLEANGGSAVTQNNINFIKVKALAYLRKGEITNCIQNHGASSCIVPIKGDGIHTTTAPVQNAIAVYTSILKFEPDDIQSRWFLNVCYMALGQYPTEVPEQYLVPDSVFASEMEFKPFKNISMPLGVDVNGHAGGASMEDFNKDGRLDIFTTGYSLAEQSKLLINSGNGFIDSTDAYGLTGLVGGLNVVHADFNNDGLTDIYIMRGAWLDKNGEIPNSLLINKGGYFSDETKQAGIYQEQPTGSVACADFNLDGYLDLFVGNESGFKSKYPCQLFLNNKDGTFTDVGHLLEGGLSAYVKGATWGDVNQDGLPDLYVSVYGAENKLFLNQGGTTIENWKFEEQARKSGVSWPKMSFTTWFWDYNQDGLQDILVFGYDNRASYAIAGEVLKDYLGQGFTGEKPRLYKNNGDGTFSNTTKEMHLDRLLYVMGANFGDLNNDGFPDMYLGTGEFNIWASVPNRAFVNDGGQEFKDVTSAGEFGQIQKGHGVAFGDFDNDGDQDIYHQVGGAAQSDVFHNMMFENPGFNNRWVSFQLIGVTSNRSAIGAKIAVKVRTEEGMRTIYHTVGTGGSFGANSLRAEIGLGRCSSIASVTIEWPNRNRTKQTFENIPLNKNYKITEGKRTFELVNLPQFTMSQMLHKQH